MNAHLIVILSCLILMMPSCATSQSQFTRLDGRIHDSKPKDFDILVFSDQAPTRPYEVIARLDVHLEKSHFVGSDLHNALPLLKQQAKQSGADAIIEIKERSSQVAETRIYHVTAKAIFFTD